MLTIDAQVHTYERDHPGRPWVGRLAGPLEVTGDDMVAAMDAVGVDGALLISPYAMYRFDPSYAIDVNAAHPGRFGLITPVDPNDPAVSEIISEWAGTNGAVGVRIMMAHSVSIAPDHPGIIRVLKTAARLGLPVNILCWGLLDAIPALVRQAPDTQLVIDHLGLPQPFSPPPPAEPFVDLPKLLALASYESIAVKITGACTLSREIFPYDDIWDPLCQIFNAFGLDRCLWGTDWTRATNLLTYEQGVAPFRETTRLTESERAMLMGESLQRVYGWAPSAV